MREPAQAAIAYEEVAVLFRRLSDRSKTVRVLRIARRLLLLNLRLPKDSQNYSQCLIWPSRLQLLLNLGLAYEWMNEFSNSVRKFSSAVTVARMGTAQDLLCALLRLGIAFDRNGESDSAQTVFEERAKLSSRRVKGVISWRSLKC